MVHIYKPEHVEVIFKSNTITSKGMFYRFFMMWLGQGLISGSGPRWRAHRKIITPSFHFKILDSYGEIFAEKGACLVNYLRKFEGKGFVEITEDLTKIGLDVITETAMGVRLGFLEGSSAEGLEYAKAIIKSVLRPD
ncbi:hypothetical protein HUJ05_006943 [Dendroctonus ponderosae]|nr:hypothetical protein HUJ05_006943 [Dendroctonus ponderosae]